MTDALEKAAVLIEQGTHPDDALIKVASEAQIPAGHIRLMVNAINTGRTNAQRLTHDDPLEKAAEFPVADASVVLKALYPDEVKTKKAAFKETVISTEYSQKPDWLKVNEPMRKVAAAGVVAKPLTDKKLIIETDPHLPMKRAMAKVSKMEIEIEQRRLKVAELREQATKLANELRTYFKRPNHIPFTEVLENSEIMFGKSAAAVLKQIEPKQDLYRLAEPITPNYKNPPYSWVKDAIKLARDYCQARQDYESWEKYAGEEATRLLRPFGPGPGQGASVLEGLSSAKTEKKAGPIGSLIGSGFGATGLLDVARSIGRRVPGLPAPDEGREKKDLRDLIDPYHDQEIRSIQAEAMLNDLMANDDVIRGHDPENVIDAFNEIAQIAPYATTQKAIMRDLLRRRLVGPEGLDNFTIGDAIKTQQNIQDIATPKRENLSVLSSVGAIPNVERGSDKK
jgi:hypothetical protein